jgi:hypothetical protein
VMHLRFLTPHGWDGLIHHHMFLQVLLLHPIQLIRWSELSSESDPARLMTLPQHRAVSYATPPH